VTHPPSPGDRLTKDDRPSSPGWAILAGQELRNLWVQGRGLLLLFGLSIFLGIFTMLLATSPDLTRMSQTSIIGLVLRVTVTVGILLVLIISADSFSGERDRSTLENLLLTPVPRSHMAFGKFVGAMSLWAGVLLVSVPYLALPAQGTGLFGHSVALCAVVGTVLVAGFYLLGAIVSAFSRSNLMSFALSLLAFFTLLAPLQLPGRARTGLFGRAILHADPVSSGITFMTRTIASGGSWSQEWAYLVAPVVFLVVVTVIGLVVFERFLTLQGGRSP
jgi:ABC-2 type transport system permease protein